MSDPIITKEELRVTGEKLLQTVKELIHEGNIRRIIIKNDEGRVLIEVPMTLGVIVALAAPVVAAIGVIGALAEKLVIVVEKTGEKAPTDVNF